MPLTHEFVVLGPGTRPLAARDRALPPRGVQGMVARKCAPAAADLRALSISLTWLTLTLKLLEFDLDLHVSLTRPESSK